MQRARTILCTLSDSRVTVGSCARRGVGNASAGTVFGRMCLRCVFGHIPIHGWRLFSSGGSTDFDIASNLHWEIRTGERSEERRGGEGGRSRWAADHLKKKKNHSVDERSHRSHLDLSTKPTSI